MIHPMQYELERAYHQRCEANAARQRLIEERQGNGDAATALQRSPFGAAVRAWRRVVSSPSLLRPDAGLTGSRSDA